MRASLPVILLALMAAGCGSPTQPTWHPNPGPPLTALSVQLFDAETKLPIPKAFVCTDKQCLETNADGYTAMPVQRDASYTLWILKQGYEDLRVHVGAYAWVFSLQRER